LGNPSEWLVDFFGSKNKSGTDVNSTTVMGIPAVYSAVRLLSETFASLPVGVYRSEGENAIKDNDHEINAVLREPNAMMTWFTFADVALTHLKLWGNFYAIILRDVRMRPIELRIVHPSEVDAIEQTGEIYYKIKGEDDLVPSYNMIHVMGHSEDGITGKSPITLLRENLGLGLASQDFGANFFGQGINPGGIVTVEDSLSDEAYKRMKSSFNAAYGGLGNAHKAILLEHGAKFTPAVRTALADAQFIESRQFQVTEVARIFKIPPHLLGDLERSTHNNIEHQAIEFVKHTVLPDLKRFEGELNRKLFMEREKGEYYIRFNVEGLLRADSLSRSELYKSLFSVGAISQNEIRAKENMNPIEGGDRYFIPTNNYTPVDKIDQVIDSSTGGQNTSE